MKKKGYDENLEILREMFPGRITITVEECAGVLGMSKQSVYSIANKAKQPLPIKKFGGRVLVPITGLASWMS